MNWFSGFDVIPTAQVICTVQQSGHFVFLFILFTGMYLCGYGLGYCFEEQNCLIESFYGDLRVSVRFHQILAFP